MHEPVPKLVQGPEQEEARGAHRVDVLHCMSNPPDKLPIVVIWTEPEARCGDGSEGEFEACVTPLTNQCGLLAAQSADPPTYIWWRTDSAGQRKPQRCAYFDIASGQYVMGFVTDVTPSKRLSLVVQGPGGSLE